MPALEDPRKEKFCLYMTRLHSQAAAARAAGYSALGARQRGWELMRLPEVKARLSELNSAHFKAIQMDNDEILARLAALARVDPRQLFNEEGQLKQIHELTSEEASMLAGFEFDKVVRTSASINSQNRLPRPIEKKLSKAGAGKPKVPTELTITTNKIKLRDPVPALRILAQHRKLIGQDADEALSNLASAFADRMQAAKQRKKKADGE